ncbi:MAG: hypothetical protein IJ548_08835 [Paludibacteraceae bacterium]|nr:hypothetical protein [Paludibacteraceae bacterium]MBQ8714302.1 hypothetical protein [Prevotella sp.]
MKKVFLLCVSLLLTLAVQAQEMKGRIYYNGYMSVNHLLGEKDGETPEQRKERETVMNEIFTMTVTIEFINSHDMRMKMKIVMDKERAKELGVSWANRKLWQADLVLKTKFYNYKSRYTAHDGVVKIEDNGSRMILSEDGEFLSVDDSDMKATLKRIK